MSFHSEHFAYNVPVHIMRVVIIHITIIRVILVRWQEDDLMIARARTEAEGPGTVAFFLTTATSDDMT